MKHLLLSCASLLAVACQSQTSSKSTAPAKAPVSLVASATAASLPTTAGGPGPVEIQKLSSQLRLGLQTCDLSALLQTVHGPEAHAQNGFFGPDHYRIEVVFTDVRRDPTRPTVYYLRGKDRYKGVITPFAGTFTIDRFGEQPYFTARQIAEATRQGGELKNEPGYYTAGGTFELREDSTHHGAGAFRGRAVIDWYNEKDGSRNLNCRDIAGPSQGGLIKYEGTWTNAATHRAYPVIWVDNIFGYAAEHQVLNDFTIGERDIDFNPKYAKLGWNSYWENDEWWTGSKHVAGPPMPAVLLSPPTIVGDTVLYHQQIRTVAAGSAQ